MPLAELLPTSELREQIPRTSLELLKRLALQHPEISVMRFRKYLFHKELNPNPESSLYLPRDLFLFSGQVEDEIQNLEGDWKIAFHSRMLLTNGQLMHLPMLDLADFSHTEENENLITSRISSVLGDNYGDGYLVETLNGYHYYGSLLISEEEQRKFLGKALLMNNVNRDGIPIVDVRWVGRCLERRAGAADLRISPKGGPDLPKVIRKMSK